MYLWETQRHYGARIEIVKTDGIHVPLEKMLEAIDEHTLIVPISHVIFRSSFLQDAKAIIERAHSVGALVLLDCFQATGCVPVNVEDLGVDFATGGVLKCLCGGPGTAYLYVRPELAPTLRPRLTGWIAAQDPFAFEIGAIKPANSQYRFMNGTPNIPALYAARPGLSIVQAAGVENIRAKSKRQVAKIIAMARQRGWRINTPEDPERRGGTVSLDLPNGKEVCAALIARDILVDHRPNAGVRMAPHFYTTDEEIDRAIAAIDSIVTGKAITSVLS
jgi:kynureninase